jgi:hypothetical protein
LITPPAELVAFLLSTLCYVLGMKKAIIFILVLTVLAILLVVLQSQTPTSLLTPETATSTETASSTNNELLRYEAEEFGFSFDYPADWNVKKERRVCKNSEILDCTDVSFLVVPKEPRSDIDTTIVIRVTDKYIRGYESTINYPVASYGATAQPINFPEFLDNCVDGLKGVKEDNIWSQYVCEKVTFNGVDILAIKDEKHPEYILYYDFYAPSKKVGVTMYSTNGFDAQSSEVLNAIAKSVSTEI